MNKFAELSPDQFLALFGKEEVKLMTYNMFEFQFGCLLGRRGSLRCSYSGLADDIYVLDLEAGVPYLIEDLSITWAFIEIESNTGMNKVYLTRLF